MSDFSGKVVIVTGGGSGIGKAIASKFVELGADVVITGRRQSVLEQAKDALGEHCYAIAGDISEIGVAKRLVSQVNASLGRIDVLVNCAGNLSMGPLSEATDEEIASVFKTNVFGVLAMIREVTTELVKTKGTVINISSINSKAVMPKTVVYSSSKAAVDHLTRILATELGGYGIRVNGIAPGVTKTEKSEAKDEHRLKMATSMTPLGRVGKPEDIANTVATLAGPESGWVTGQIVQVSGGLMLGG